MQIDLSSSLVCTLVSRDLYEINPLCSSYFIHTIQPLCCWTDTAHQCRLSVLCWRTTRCAANKPLIRCCRGSGWFNPFALRCSTSVRGSAAASSALRHAPTGAETTCTGWLPLSHTEPGARYTVDGGHGVLLPVMSKPEAQTPRGYQRFRTTMKRSGPQRDGDRSLRTVTVATPDLLSEYRAYSQAHVTPIPELHFANPRTSTWSYDVLRQMFNQTFRKTKALSDIKSGVCRILFSVQPPLCLCADA